MPRQSVKFYDDERLDRVDADALQALVYSHVGDVIGALLGYASGCLSLPSVAFSTTGLNYFIDLGSFSYMRSVATLSDGGFGRVWETEVCVVDASSGSQLTTAVYTGVRAYAATQIAGGVVPATATAAFPFIWARPYNSDEDTNPRRKWDAGPGAEVPFSSPTRTSRRSFLVVAATQPGTAADPWVPVGKIASWPNVVGADPGEPLIVPITIWDSEEAHAVGEYPGNWWGSLYDDSAQVVGVDVTTLAYAAREGTKVLDGFGGDLTDGFDGSKMTNKTMGLVQLLAFARGRIQRVLTSTDTQPWWAVPTASLDDLDTTSAANAAAIAAIAGQPLVWFSAYVYWDGANYVVGGGTGGGAFNVASATKGAVGVILVTPTAALPSGSAIVGASANGNVAIEGATSLTYIGPHFTVDLFDAVGAHKDGSFYIEARRSA